MGRGLMGSERLMGVDGFVGLPVQGSEAKK